MSRPGIVKLAVCGALAFAATATGSRADAGTLWPHGARAAVVLTYDDALDSQLDHAVPELDADGFKATFFLANVKQADVPRWRAVAAEGHELGNHTIFHACAAKTVPNETRYTLEDYTTAGILREIAQQNVLLTALDGRDRHGFATPCGDSHVTDGDYLEALRRSGLVTYVRGVVTTQADLSGDASQVDLMHIPSRGWPEGTTGDQLIDFAQQAVAGGGWAVFLFHGVGGDYLQVSDAAHRQLLGWLKAHRREVWVTTLQNATDWAKAHPGPVAR
ncbi:polysaccharide deacetylase family protein [Sphingomonas oryzagri]|uniref:Chitooligosaccharide deacetylase n=1 Tax=Sphingomonas oryzagri TaxID=3042314 RepID=A0ABT6MWF8_9SPHN|nr:polysaccharide deacetylase family protein [Sphingomonas oryzagri]MDH7637379.1 polysaccharide deacetylase family protein [Sphingomonas oryzagri]